MSDWKLSIIILTLSSLAELGIVIMAFSGATSDEKRGWWVWLRRTTNSTKKSWNISSVSSILSWNVTSAADLVVEIGSKLKKTMVRVNASRNLSKPHVSQISKNTWINVYSSKHVVFQIINISKVAAGQWFMWTLEQIFKERRTFPTSWHKTSHWREGVMTWKRFPHYRKISNIRRTESPNWNASRLVLQLPLPNPMKPGVESRMKM